MSVSPVPNVPGEHELGHGDPSASCGGWRASRCPPACCSARAWWRNYLFALHDLDLSVADSRAVAVTILVACGLYLVMALEAEGSRRRSTLVAGMCAVLAGLYLAALLLPGTRRFFELTVPGPGMIVTAVLASGVAIAALGLCGFSLRVAPGPERRAAVIGPLLVCFDGSEEAAEAIRRAGALMPGHERSCSVAIPAKDELPLDPPSDLVGRFSGVYRDWDEAVADLAGKQALRGCELASESGCRRVR